MTTDHRDLLFLTEALPQMQEYLLSNELYWPLSASLPRLTPGTVLLAMARSQVLSPAQAQEHLLQFDIIRSKWRSAWQTKIGRESSNRLRLWSNFLSDYGNSPEHNADAYTGEVRGRVILKLLLHEVPNLPEKSALDDLDEVLRARLRSTDFLWDAALQLAFPKEDFWFLYGKL